MVSQKWADSYSPRLNFCQKEVTNDIKIGYMYVHFQFLTRIASNFVSVPLA